MKRQWRMEFLGVGLQVSANDMKSSPLNVSSIPEWRRGTLMGEDVYTARVYFVSKGGYGGESEPL